MNDREKLLAAAVGVLVLVAGAFYAWDSVARKFRQGRSKIAALQVRIADLQQEKDEAERGMRRVKHYEERSLPSDENLAQNLYQQWLLKIITDVGLEKPSVDLNQVRRKGNSYRELGFRVTGQGDLKQVTELLYRFFHASNLDRVGRMLLTPVSDSNDLKIDMGVQALVLPGATRTSQLNTDPSNRLALSELSQYSAAIADRNFFAPANLPPSLSRIRNQTAYLNEPFQFVVQASDPDAHDTLTYSLEDDAPDGMRIDGRAGRISWTPSELGSVEFTLAVADNGLPTKNDRRSVQIVVQPPQPKSNAQDEGYTHLTGTFRGEELVAFIEHRISGKRFKLQVGDDFRAGELEGTVERIGWRDVDLVVGGRTVRVSLGDNISQGELIRTNKTTPTGGVVPSG